MSHAWRRPSERGTLFIYSVDEFCQEEIRVSCYLDWVTLSCPVGDARYWEITKFVPNLHDKM